MHTRYCKDDKRSEKMITTMVIMMKMKKANRCEICDRRISDKQTQCYHCRTESKEGVIRND